MSDDKDTGIEKDIYEALVTGPVYPFSQGLHADVPCRAGVYTIWKDAEFIYVGIAGRGLEPSAEIRGMKGLRDRLDSHYRGRRSGDQFAVYVCDRRVIPALTPEQIHGIGTGDLSLDALTRVYIHENLSYRFAVMPNYKDASRVESLFAKGRTPIGFPVLNPQRGKVSA